MPNRVRRLGLSRLLEVLAIVVLLATFVRTASSSYSRHSAQPLEAGADPRLLLVDLVSLQQRARSTRLPHQVRFLTDRDGLVHGYEVSVDRSWSTAGELLKTRVFADQVHVMTSRTHFEFAADGTTSHDCRIAFNERQKNWLLTIAERSGEMRLLEASAPLE